MKHHWQKLYSSCGKDFILNTKRNSLIVQAFVGKSIWNQPRKVTNRLPMYAAAWQLQSGFSGSDIAVHKLQCRFYGSAIAMLKLQCKLPR